VSGPGAVVVGTSFGGLVHVPALRAAGFTVLALVGRDAERTRRRADRLEVPNAMTSLEDALTLPGVDAVTIATPPASHCDLAVAAAGAGKHVVCEKPFALDTRQAAAMLDAAEAAGVTHLVGHEFRWATDRALAARAIADGAIGEPRLASFVQWLPLVADPEIKMPSWWFDRGAGGGWLGASGSHVVDQVRAWLGEIVTVSASLPLVSDRAPGAAEDSFVVRLGLASGVEAVLQQTAGAWGPPVSVTRVTGTRGTVWLEDGVAWVADASGSRQLPVPVDLELPPAPPESEDPRHRFTHLELGSYTRLCEVLRAGVDRRPVPTAVPVPTFADGAACTRALDAIRASAARGGEVVRL